MLEWQASNAEYIASNSLSSRERQVPEPEVPLALEAGKVYPTAGLPAIEIADGVNASICWGRGTLLEWLTMEPGATYPQQLVPGELISSAQRGSATCMLDGQTIELSGDSLLYLTDGADRTLTAGPEGFVAMEVFSPVLVDHLAQAGTVLSEDADVTFPDQGIEPMLEPGHPYRFGALKRSPIKLPSSEPDAPPVAHATLLWVRNFMLSFIRMDGNCFFPHHFHPEDQLMLCLDGSMKEGIIDQWLPMSDMDVIWQPGGMVHAAQVSPEGVDVVDVFWPVRPDYIEMVS